MTVVRSAPAATRAARVLDAVFYGGCLVVLAGLALHWQSVVLPARLATQAGHQSEVFALALLLGLVIDAGHARWRHRRSGVAPALAIAVMLALVATLLMVADLPPTLRTLNEPVVATALLTASLGARRPLTQPWRYAVLVVALMVLGGQVTLLRAQAEAITAVLAALVSFELVDRSVLQPGRLPSRWLWPWLGFLLVWPAIMLAADDRGVAGVLGRLVDVQARGAEGYWGVLLLHVFLVVRRPQDRRDLRASVPSTALRGDRVVDLQRAGRFPRRS